MLNRAIKKASEIKDQKQRIYAIICDKKGTILSYGENSYTRTHPKQCWYAKKVGMVNRIFIHAEISALVNCRKQGHTIYIARLDKKNRPLPCDPCPICKMAISEAGIKEIVTT